MKIGQKLHKFTKLKVTKSQSNRISQISKELKSLERGRNPNPMVNRIKTPVKYLWWNLSTKLVSGYKLHQRCFTWFLIRFVMESFYILSVLEEVWLLDNQYRTSAPLYFTAIELLQSVEVQKQPFRGVLRKRCSENMQQIYRRTTMLKCDFNKVALKLQHHNGVLL